MKKNMKRNVVVILFTAVYAVILGLGECCFVDVLLSKMFGGISRYPRFIPFGIIVGYAALGALIAVFVANLKLSKKINFTKWTWVIQTVCAVILSVPMFRLWLLLFNFLHKTF